MRGRARVRHVLAAALATGLALTPCAAAQGPRSAVIVQVRAPGAPLGRAAPGTIALRLQQRARHDQAALLRLLRRAVRDGEASHVESLWIDDSIAVHASAALIAQLRARRDVAGIEPDRPLTLQPAAVATSPPPALSASVAATGAPALWAQGQTGKGVVVAVLDTGVAPDFPLAHVPGAWFDPYGQHRTPYDADAEQHGTDVADVLASVAPGAEIIAARVFSDDGKSSTSAVHRAFEWALDPDGNPRTNDAPKVVNGSWDDGASGQCETEFDSDLAALRAAGIVPVFAAGNSGPGPGTGASPASSPGAVPVGSVGSDDLPSTFSGRGPSPCGGGPFPALSAYGEQIPVDGPAGPTLVSGTSFAAPQVSGAVALLAGMFPGATPDAIVTALVEGARDVGAPGPDDDTGAGVLDIPQAAAVLAAGDHASPRVSVSAAWSRDSAHPGLVLSGRAREVGGTTAGLTASAFISLLGVPIAPYTPLSATPLGTGDARLAGLIGPHALHRLLDGHHRLFVRARDATGNWGAARVVALPVDRAPPSVSARDVRRRGTRVALQLLARDGGSGLATVRFRVVLAGRAGRWHSLGPAARRSLSLWAPRGRRAVLQVQAGDVAGNRRRASFVLNR